VKPIPTILIGGPGRSGTTFVASELGRHPAIASFDLVELKFLYERDGLWDLGWVLCESFSPNRAWVALARFRQLVNQLCNGGFNQPLLAGPGVYKGVQDALNRFLAALAREESVPRAMRWEAYVPLAREFFFACAGTCMRLKPGADIFLEKTPHNLLSPDGILAFVPGARCLHVVRDPRATAASLLRQKWGPTTVSGAIAWVRSYYAEWVVRRTRFPEVGIPLMEIRIEDIAERPRAMRDAVLGFLAAPPSPSLFARAERDKLGAWRTTSDPDAVRRIDAALAPLAEEVAAQARFG
jgi:hypothetical protein